MSANIGQKTGLCSLQQAIAVLDLIAERNAASVGTVVGELT